MLALLVTGLTVGPASGGFTPPALKGTPQFVITGHGWGHGVGMSQWGAYGYAQKGVAYDKIVTHYFPGTKLDTTTVKSIRVLLAQSPSITISSTGPWKIKDGSAAAVTMPAGKITLNPAAGVQGSGDGRAAELPRAARVHVADAARVQAGVSRHVHRRRPTASSSRS